MYEINCNDEILGLNYVFNKVICEIILLYKVVLIFFNFRNRIIVYIYIWVVIGVNLKFDEVVELILFVVVIGF